MDEIEKMKEWQENQYNPGYWTGGNIPHYLLRKNKKLGWVFMVSGLIALLLLVWFFIEMKIPSSELPNFILYFVLTLVYIFVGYKKIKGD